jgi:hypothetical protein
MRVTLTDPSDVEIYKSDMRKASTTFLTSPGVFRVCFANMNYVSLSKLRVYMRLELTTTSLQVGYVII